MPGEFEPHAGCWMLWPERSDNWRLGAKPAQRAFSAVATAIADYEPVTMGVSARQYEVARATLPAHIRVVELSADDAWMRDVGPTFLVNDHSAVRGSSTGLSMAGAVWSTGSTFRGIRTTKSRARSVRSSASTAIARPISSSKAVRSTSTAKER